MQKTLKTKTYVLTQPIICAILSVVNNKTFVLAEGHFLDKFVSSQYICQGKIFESKHMNSEERCDHKEFTNNTQTIFFLTLCKLEK